MDLKERVTDWSTTVPGVIILIFTGFIAYLEPDFRKNPTTILGFAGGLLAVFGFKGNK